MPAERPAAAEPPDLATTPRAAVPKMNGGLDLARLPLTPEEAFVMTRVDGRTNLGEICLISGLGEAKTRAILGRLRAMGAVLLPGDVWPRPAPEPPATAEPGYDPVLLDEPCGLSREVKRRVLAVWSRLYELDLFALLEIADGADKREVKRAYFRLAKEFHPDRHYGTDLGTYAARLQDVFKRMTLAFETLSDDAKRAAYLARRDEARRRGLSPGYAAGGGPAAREKQSAASRSTGGSPATPGGADVRAIRFAEAQALLKRIRHERAMRARRLHEDATASLAIGDAAAAVRALRTAVALSPQSSSYRETLARALAEARAAAAEELLQEAERIAPSRGAAAVLRVLDVAVAILPEGPTFERAARLAKEIEALERADEYAMKLQGH